MAVKSTFAMGFGWPVDMRADLGDHGRPKRDIGNKVTVHDVHVQPIRPLLHLVRTFPSERREIGAENRGRNNGGGTHGGGMQI